MLNTPIGLSRHALHIGPEAVHGRSAPTLRQLFIGTPHQIATIAMATMLSLGAGLSYVLVVPAHYTAAAQLLIDTQRSRSPLDAPNTPIDPAVIASQVETLKSETVALTVISGLGLDKDPEFTQPDFMARILGWLEVGGTRRLDPQRARRQSVVNHFGRALDVVQAGHSYAAIIRFSSVDPDKAARIANAICDAYIDDQLEARTWTATRAKLWLERRLGELQQQLAQSNQALELFRTEHPGTLDGIHQEQWRSLEASAQAKKRAYDTFQNFSRYSQTMEQQSFPTTEARVLTQAEPPLTRSWPNIWATLLLSVAAGCGVGMGIAYAREHLGATVRARHHLERESNLKCLGFLPLLRRGRWRTWRRLSFRGPRIPLLTQKESGSHPGEMLISVRVALDALNQSSTGTTIGITSPHSGEGKTTVAVNLAKCMSESGKRVLLVDADLRGRSLTRALAPDSKHRLAEILRGDLSLTEIAVVPELGFQFLAQPLDHVTQRPPDILSSRQMAEMLQTAKLTFDYVVLDLPPAMDHVDVRASANQIDFFLLVAEWGRTRVTDLDAVYAGSDHMAERVIGVIVNKAPPGSPRC